MHLRLFLRIYLDKWPFNVHIKESLTDNEQNKIIGKAKIILLNINKSYKPMVKINGESSKLIIAKRNRLGI